MCSAHLEPSGSTCAGTRFPLDRTEVRRHQSQDECQDRHSTANIIGEIHFDDRWQKWPAIAITSQCLINLWEPPCIVGQQIQRSARDQHIEEGPTTPRTIWTCQVPKKAEFTLEDWALTAWKCSVFPNCQWQTCSLKNFLENIEDTIFTYCLHGNMKPNHNHMSIF